MLNSFGVRESCNKTLTMQDRLKRQLRINLIDLIENCMSLIQPLCGSLLSKGAITGYHQQKTLGKSCDYE